jgi:hypothetical protein
MKRTASFLLVAILLISIFGQGVYASTSTSDYEKVLQEVEKANLKIDEMIQKAVAEADILHNQVLTLQQSDIIDQKIQSEINKLDAKIDQIIAELIVKTDELSRKTIEYGAQYGVALECVYIPVMIGGRLAYIDPLRIIGT